LSAAGQPGITIAYSISVPSDASSTLAAKRTVQIPVTDLSSLSEALDKARNETNATLTQWKDEIGELEKAKETRVAKEANERRKLKKAAAAEDAEGESSDEDEQDDEQ
jgi:HAMP domain-containing protein